MTLTFEEPPPAHTEAGHPTYQTIAAELRSAPGKWAVVKFARTQRSAATIAYAIKRGSYTAFRPVGEWDACSRTVDGQFRVYARWVGGDRDEPPRR